MISDNSFEAPKTQDSCVSGELLKTEVRGDLNPTGLGLANPGLGFAGQTRVWVFGFGFCNI